MAPPAGEPITIRSAPVRLASTDRPRLALRLSCVTRSAGSPPSSPAAWSSAVWASTADAARSGEWTAATVSRAPVTSAIVRARASASRPPESSTYPASTCSRITTGTFPRHAPRRDPPPRRTVNPPTRDGTPARGAARRPASWPRPVTRPWSGAGWVAPGRGASPRERWSPRRTPVPAQEGPATEEFSPPASGRRRSRAGPVAGGWSPCGRWPRPTGRPELPVYRPCSAREGSAARCPRAPDGAPGDQR